VKKKTASLQGNLFLLNGDHQSFTSSQIQLLIAIRDCGSITSAAKSIGISYKTAWDRIDRMNNMSDKVLIIRAAGGAKGGGTTVTDTGRQVISGFLSLQREHQAFINRLGQRVNSLGDVAGFIRSNEVRSSARNQYRGVISKLTRGEVNTEVAVRISDSVTLTALITNDSRGKLGLIKGSNVFALIKSSWIVLSNDTKLQTSARNHLVGKIVRISTGEVNSEVLIALGEEKSLCAIITNTSVNQLKLKKGSQVCAFFKASSVILMAE